MIAVKAVPSYKLVVRNFYVMHWTESREAFEGKNNYFLKNLITSMYASYFTFTRQYLHFYVQAG